MSGARYPRLRKVVFALLPVVVLLLGVEVAFRLRKPPAEYFTRRDIAVTDPDLLWRLRPYESGPLATNELGLRGPRARARQRAPAGESEPPRRPLIRESPPLSRSPPRGPKTGHKTAKNRVFARVKSRPRRPTIMVERTGGDRR